MIFLLFLQWYIFIKIIFVCLSLNIVYILIPCLYSFYVSYAYFLSIIHLYILNMYIYTYKLNILNLVNMLNLVNLVNKLSMLNKLNMLNKLSMLNKSSMVNKLSMLSMLNKLNKLNMSFMWICRSSWVCRLCECVVKVEYTSEWVYKASEYV